MSEFADNLDRCVKASGKSLAHIAHDLSISVRTLNHYTSGSRSPRLEQLPQIADYFGISLDALVCGRNEPYKGPPKIVLSVSDPMLETAIELVERGLADAPRQIPADKKAALIVSVLEYLQETSDGYSQATINNMIRLAA